MSQSWNNVESASRLISALQTDPEFEHSGQDSRGIDFQVEPFIKDLAELASNYDGLSQELIMDCASLIKTVASDFGGYIRIKGKEAFTIEIRGLTGYEPPEPNLISLRQIALHRSALGILIEPTRTKLYFKTDFLLATDNSGREFDDMATDKVKRLGPNMEAQIATDILQIVVRHVAQIGEFQNLE